MNSQLRIGIMGTGGIVTKCFLPAVKESKLVRVTAIASRTIEKARSIAAELHCNAFEGYETLLKNTEIDVVYIALPIGLHSKWAIEAAKHGKHVLCEKSLSVNLREAEDIVKACEHNGVALMEGFAYQFHPQHLKVRELVENGAIGQPIHCTVLFGFPPIASEHRYNRDLGGGALLDCGTYTVHFARRLFGKEPLHVSASLHNNNHAVDIHGTVLLDFGECQSASLAFGFENAYRNSYDIWGTTATLSVRRAFSTPSNFTAILRLEKQGEINEIPIAPFNQFSGELEAFVTIVEDRNLRTRWYQDAINQARVLERIRMSA